MTLFFQLIVSGLGFGAVYALGAISLTVIFNTSNVVNFASASLSSAVALLMWLALVRLHLSVLLAWLFALVAAMVIGALVEAAFLRRVERSSLIVQIVMTLGLLVAIEGLDGALYGFNPKTLPHVIHGPSIAIGSVFLDRNDAFILGLTLVLTFVLYLVYQRTRLGLALRAVASDREVASLMGIQTQRMVSLSWAIGVLLAGVSAILIAPSISLTPTFMENVAVFAFAAAVLGGFGSLPGALVGGLLIGVMSNLISGYLSNNLQLTFVFIMILLVLYVRPNGLFGKRVMSRQ
ncbi:MAG: branched-chain amino acid ABC transporter permease [Nitrospiraceae bacterium]|nr:branched-chain amino acid ABC transporter permease [Nitrospiraceae bacterium]